MHVEDVPLTFELPDLARRIDALPRRKVDALPFGAILLDDAGQVLFYSETERRQSGSGNLARLGLDFFGAIAPCMDTPLFRGRIDAARRAGTLNLEFTHVGDFEDRNREICVRVQSSEIEGYWVFLQRR